MTLVQLIVDINWTLKKYNVHFILSSDPTAYECSLAMMPTAIH